MQQRIKQVAGFLVLISDSLIISSIKAIVSFRLLFHVSFLFGTEKLQRSLSVPWVTLFIFSFTKPRGPLENTSGALMNFWALGWATWTGLGVECKQRTALGSIPSYQVIASWEMMMRQQQAGGVITMDHDMALCSNSNNLAFQINGEARCCWEGCQWPPSTSVYSRCGWLGWEGVRDVKCNVTICLDFPLLNFSCKKNLSCYLLCLLSRYLSPYHLETQTILRLGFSVSKCPIEIQTPPSHSLCNAVK